MPIIMRTIVAILATTLFATRALAATPEERCAKGVGEDAITACTDVIGIGTGGPDIEWAYFDRARAYFDARLYASAIADLTDALRLKPDDAEALENRGLAFLALDDFRHAIHDFDRVVELKPASADGFRERCWARAASGRDLDDALQDCNQALTLKPGDAAARDAQCFVEYRNTAYAAAIADCTAAVALDAKLASSLYLRGLAKLKTNDATGGNADIAAAKALDPSIADTYAAYGVKP
jgi:tetratricopeptide (TPR) repeat protein